MDIETTITKEKKNNVVDMLVSLIVAELSEDLELDPDETFFRFLTSKTAELLYDEDARLWWNGPSYIVQLYKEEMRG